MANGPGSINPTRASELNYNGDDLPNTVQAVNAGTAVGHRYALSGNATTPYVGVDECYKTYAGVQNQPL